MPSESSTQPADAGISRQARWQRKRVAAGLCSICGQSRGEGSTTIRCAKCHRKDRAYKKRVTGIGSAYQRGHRRQHGDVHGSSALADVRSAPVMTLPTAVYLGLQERIDLPPVALYTIQGGPSDRSTVTAEKLRALGIAVPVDAREHVTGEGRF